MTKMLVVAVALAAASAWLLWKSGRAPARTRITERLDAVGRGRSLAASELELRDRNRYAAFVLTPIHRTFLLAGIKVRPVHQILVAVMVVTTFAVGFILNAYVAAAALAIAAAGATMYLQSIAVRNRMRFLEGLPTFIDRLQQFLAAGNSLVMAFEKALDYSSPLTRNHLRPVALRLAHGATLAESLLLQGERLGIAELTMMSVIVHANMRFGGSLSDVLSRLAASLNNRQQVQREFNAMTAEMRSSAKVLVALPILVSAAVFVISPQYLSFFANDPLGQILIGGAAGCATLGAVVLHHMTRIED